MRTLGMTELRASLSALFWLSASALLLWELSQLGLWGWAAVLICLPISWAAADLTTGTVHWILDRYGTTETPILGVLIHDFREHHVLPKRILDDSLLVSSANAAIPALPIMAGMVLLGLPAWAIVAALVWLMGCVGTNSFHLLAHTDTPPPVAAWLQRRGLILSPEEHARHHTGAHEVAYCITVGWVNPWLERFRVYQRLEAIFPPTVGVSLAEPERSEDGHCA